MMDWSDMAAAAPAAPDPVAPVCLRETRTFLDLWNGDKQRSRFQTCLRFDRPRSRGDDSAIFFQRTSERRP